MTESKITGLTAAQVQKQKAAGHINKNVEDQSKSNWGIIRENVFTYFNLIFLILALLLIWVGAYNDLTFLPVIIINTVIGIIQEMRAKQVLSKLKVMHATQATVIRDGQEKEISVEELVLDDVILLKTGDQIPADAKVISGELHVNEALLTGESDEILKQKDSQLMSGSFVVSGKAYACLTKVGADSYISQLTLKAKKMGQGEQSEMIRAINRLIKWVGIIIIPLGLGMFGLSYFVNGETLKHSVTSMEAAIIGMIPEGLYLLTTIALALAAMRLAKRQVMLHDMRSVETLARVNILCVDKTGTITEPEMSVTKLVPSKHFPGNIEQVLSIFASKMPADNATSKAIANYFKNQKIEGVAVERIIPFTSVNKYSGLVLNGETLLLGAPEILLAERLVDYQNEFEKYAQEGYRVLLLARYPEELKDEHSKLKKDVDVIGYVLLSNPIRKEAKATFEYFAKQGVAIKVISGDNPITVSRIAKQAGIADADKYVDAQTIIDYDDAVKNYNVFGRVKPEQKKKFVQALKGQGNTVAMTGDGVNDILAMKEADCSIAMASGNSATIQAAQVVLLDSNFAKMPNIVNQGRQVVNNIQRSASLFLVKNIFSFLLAIFTLVMTVSYPLQPSHITLISGFMIGIPSFLLALETNHQQIKGKFMLNVLTNAVPGGVTDMIAVALMVIADLYFGIGRKDVSTTATLLLVAVGMMVLCHIAAPLNKFRSGVIISSFLLLIFSAVSFHHLFDLTLISNTSFFLFIILFLASITIFKFFTQICDRIRSINLEFTENGQKMTLKDLKEGLLKKIR